MAGFNVTTEAAQIFPVIGPLMDPFGLPNSPSNCGYRSAFYPSLNLSVWYDYYRFVLEIGVRAYPRLVF
jgi:hypothetical protein